MREIIGDIDQSTLYQNPLDGIEDVIRRNHPNIVFHHSSRITRKPGGGGLSVVHAGDHKNHIGLHEDVEVARKKIEDRWAGSKGIELYELTLGERYFVQGYTGTVNGQRCDNGLFTHGVTDGTTHS